MCIAILKPLGASITDAILRESQSHNKDGSGYAFIGAKNKVVIRKGLMKIEDFIAKYREDEAVWGEKSPFLIHFRITTGGGVTPENCHPFETKHGALMHNGYFFPADADKSDTNVLVERAGEFMSKKAVTENKDALEKHFGYNNKVVLLFKDRSTIILNEKAGEWSEGVWYSNRGYCNWGVRTRTQNGERFAAQSTSNPNGSGADSTLGQLRPSGHRFRDKGEQLALAYGIDLDSAEDPLDDRRWAAQWANEGGALYGGGDG